MRRGVAGWICLVLGACATAPRPTSGPSEVSPTWWDLPAGSAPHQYLFRLDGDGPDGKADLKLTLILESRDRFQVVASGPLGRRLWRLEVGGGDAIWTTEEPARSCRLGAGDRLRLASARLDLPVSRLPELLLGRLPVAPRDGATAGDAAGRWLGEDGRWWRFDADGSGPVRWTVWSADLRPVAWWRRADRGGELSLREPAVRLRWQLVAESPRVSPLGALQSGGRVAALEECPDALP